MLRNILLGLGVFSALLAVLIFSGKVPLGSKKDLPQGEVVLWGTFPATGMNDILQEFNPQAKTYRITYREVRVDRFEQQLLEALANGTGPDLILAPYQIILSQESRIYPFPLSSVSEKLYKDTYVDAANVMFTQQGALALPVSVEPMVMFYNRTLFSKQGIVNPPAYWDEVAALTPQLTTKTSSVQFSSSAIALGSVNTPYAKDILMSMVGQLGQIPVLRQSNAVGESYMNVLANTPATEGGDIAPLTSATRFFVQFSDPNQKVYTWNQYSGNAQEQFLAERLAMYLGFSGELSTLRAQNPRAEIQMTYFPQTKGYNTFTMGARMYGIATLRSSKNLVTALNAEAALGSAGVTQALALIVGGLPPQRAYAATPGLDPVLARSMLVARGWYDSHYADSDRLVNSMLGDALSGRQGVVDSVSLFVSRLQDLYTGQ